jgi:hypothetical protein
LDCVIISSRITFNLHKHITISILLYAAHDNSGPCCCYHCCLYERDQSGQRDTAVATTPEIPSASVAVATNMDHQQEVAWEVYSNTGEAAVSFSLTLH